MYGSSFEELQCRRGDAYYVLSSFDQEERAAVTTSDNYLHPILVPSIVRERLKQYIVRYHIAIVNCAKARHCTFTQEPTQMDDAFTLLKSNLSNT